MAPMRSARPHESDAGGIMRERREVDVIDRVWGNITPLGVHSCVMETIGLRGPLAGAEIPAICIHRTIRCR